MNKNLSPKAQQDYELVQLAVRKKDQRAYTELMDRYWENVFYLLMKMVKDKAVAEDLAIETFAKAFKYLNRYEPDFAFSTWIFKIATNNCIDHIRKQRMTLFSIDQPIITEEGRMVQLEIESEALDPEELYMGQQKNNILRRLVEKVRPERYRLLLECRYFKEMPYEEIAKELRLPLGTVKAQLFKARELLYEIIKRTNTKGNV